MMPNPEARAIIETAMSSREAYEEMAKKESDVWARHFGNRHNTQVQAEDQAAALELGLNENTVSFPQWCKKNGRKFKRGLSIGCGAGRAERQFIELGICEEFHAVDISEGAIEQARAEAEKLGLACTYEAMDVNFGDLGENKYDLVLAQTSLHHLVFLEDVFDAIKRAMVTDGVLWVNDYCGESQFQHSDLRISIANRILKEIPEPFRLNKMNKIQINEIARRKPGTLISPFESIRSGDILPLMKERFKVITGGTSSAILHLVCPVGTRAHYLKNDESRALFRSLKAFDELLIEHGVLEGVSARYVFQK